MLDYYKKDSAGAAAAWARSKQYARDARVLAPRFTGDSKYGTVIFQINIALGTHALREGDRQTAVRYLLEASRAPASLELELSQGFELEQQLVNYLLAAGERDSIVEYLERIAQVRTGEREHLLKDAANIRAGVMPVSYQFMVTRRSGR